MNSPVTAQNLLATELEFIAFMRDLWFGLIERVQIRDGQIVSSPAPVTIRQIKFGASTSSDKEATHSSEIRSQVAELFSYVRAVNSGEIRSLDVRHGIPFSMEIEQSGFRTGREDSRG